MPAVTDRAEFRELGVLVAVEEYHDDGTGTRTTYDPDGTVTGTEELTGLPIPDVASDPAASVLAAVQTARGEVKGYAANNGTRQAVEALATAVETLVQGATP